MTPWTLGRRRQSWAILAIVFSLLLGSIPLIIMPLHQIESLPVENSDLAVHRNQTVETTSEYTVDTASLLTTIDAVKSGNDDDDDNLPGGAPQNDSAVLVSNRSSRNERREHAATRREADHEYDESRGSSGSVAANASSASALIFLPPPSEWFDDVDTNSSVVGCGFSKCAFRSRTSQREGRADPDRRDRYGYLVANSLASVEGVFALARELSEAFSIRHTLLAEPIFVANDSDGTLLYVQPIELYPKDSVLFKCKEFGIYKAMESVKSLESFSAAVDPRAFEGRFRSDLDKTKRMMDSRHGPCLSNDFQLVIDAITGGIIHIDLDRCNAGKRKRRNNFLESGMPAGPGERCRVAITGGIVHIDLDRCNEGKKKRRNKFRKGGCLRDLENVAEYLIARKYLHAIDGDGTRRGEDRDEDIGERIGDFRETVELLDNYTETHKLPTLNKKKGTKEMQSMRYQERRERIIRRMIETVRNGNETKRETRLERERTTTSPRNGTRSRGAPPRGGASP